MIYEPYSVLISVYADEKPLYLRRSVCSMLEQSVPPDEVVLVCDGPLTPELNMEIEQLQAYAPELFQIIRLKENVGLGEALGIGLLRCKHNLVARMDSDDIAVPDRMKWQLEALTLNQDISIIGGQIAEFLGHEENVIEYRIVPLEHEDIYQWAMKRSPVNHMTVTFRKADVLAAGNYISFKRLEDYHLWTRLLVGGYRFMNLDRVCVYARVDRNTYRRRGGIEYFRQTLKLERFMRSSGLISTGRFLMNCAVRFIGTVLIPSSIRARLYELLLRKRRVEQPHEEKTEIASESEVRVHNFSE